MAGTASLPGWQKRLYARRAIAAALLVLAGVLALRDGEDGTPVVVAAREIPAGARLAAADLRVVGMPPSLVPEGALRSPDAATGRTLTAPAAPGEAITDGRVLSPRTTSDDSRAVALHPADDSVTAALRSGDVVDVLAVPRDGSLPHRVVARDAVVVLAAGEAVRGARNPVVLVSLPESAAADVAAAGLGGELTVLLR